MYLLPIDPASEIKVGFVVSKQVGNAVLRNRAKRRLRAISRTLIANYPNGVMLAIRVKPEIHGLSHADLTEQFLNATNRLFAKFAAIGTRLDSEK